MESLPSIDFIVLADLRDSLEQDLAELQKATASGAHKTMLVLAGSIVETVLLDYILAEQLLPQDEATKLDFAGLLQSAQKGKLISQRTFELSTVVKNYRNLIHPGRALRLSEKTDSDSATVASTLVSMVLREVAALRKSKHGYNAAQIVAKLNKDSSASSMLMHLLDGTSDQELTNLMVKALPAAYFAERQLDEPSHSRLRTYAACFVAAFEKAGESSRELVRNWFLQLYREGSDEQLNGYGIVFLRLNFFPASHAGKAKVIVSRVLAQMEPALEDDLLDTLSGIGPHISKAQVEGFVDPLVRQIVKKNEKADLVLFTESLGMTDALRSDVVARMKAWEKMFTQQQNAERAALIKDAMSYIAVPSD